MTTNQMVNDALQKAVNERMAQKGRLFDIEPLREPSVFDPEVIKHASNQAGDNVAWSLLAKKHDEFKPIVEGMQGAAVKYFEEQGESEEFLHFVKNHALTSENIMDFLEDMAQAEDNTDGEN